MVRIILVYIGVFCAFSKDNHTEKVHTSIATVVRLKAAITNTNYQLPRNGGFDSIKMNV